MESDTWKNRVYPAEINERNCRLMHWTQIIADWQSWKGVTKKTLREISLILFSVHFGQSGGERSPSVAPWSSWSCCWVAFPWSSAFFLLFCFVFPPYGFLPFHVSVCLLNLTAANCAHISSEIVPRLCRSAGKEEKMPSRSSSRLPKPATKWHNFSVSEFQQETRWCASPSRVLIYPCGNMR